MEKRNLRVGVVIVFAAILTVLAFMGGNTETAEMAQVQDAMRNLRRVDNLHFSYESKLYSVPESTKEEVMDGSEENSDQVALEEELLEEQEMLDMEAEPKGDVISTQRVEVWSDQLTGAWVAEYYTTDEDGTRPVLKQYCNGNVVYQYVDWNGEWSLRSDLSTEVPNIESMISLDYDGNDIINTTSSTENDHQKISYMFTSEYLEKKMQGSMDEMEQIFSNYQKSGVSGDELKSAELVVEKQRRTRMEDVQIVYTIDSEGVLCNSACTLVLIQPEIISLINGRQLLGEDKAKQLLVEIDIKGYNQAGITNKIQQCQNELMY